MVRIFYYRLWLYNIARGIDLEPVTQRFSSKSIGCCKKFPGRVSIKGIATLKHWLTELATEIFERIEQDEMEYNRRAKQMVVSFMQEINNEDISSSRSIPLISQSIDKIAGDALDVIKKNTTIFFKTEQNTELNNPIKFLGLSVGKFEENDNKNQNTIETMFKNQAQKSDGETNTNVESMKTEIVESKKDNDVVQKTTGIKSFFSEKSISKNDNLKIESKENEIDQNLNNIEKELIDDRTNDQTMKNPISKMFNQQAEKVKYNNNNITTTFNESNLNNLQNQENKSSILLSDCDKNSIETECNTSDNIINFQDNIIQSDSVLNNKHIDEVESCSAEYEIGESSNSALLPETSHSEPTDYKKSYAEFYTPANLPQLKELCSQCNKKIPVIEMLAHNDAHFAFQLSQEQRQEFRDQLKLKTNSPAAKKPKLERNLSANKKPGSQTTTFNTINKFLLKSSNDSVDVNDREKCPDCGKLIAINAIAEHSDWHTAKKLQQELNDSLPRSSQTMLEMNKQNNSGKVDKKSKGKLLSVASFFK